eukprot:5533709-Amphidinium_carterae.1
MEEKMDKNRRPLYFYVEEHASNVAKKAKTASLELKKNVSSEQRCQAEDNFDGFDPFKGDLDVPTFKRAQGSSTPEKAVGGGKKVPKKPAESSEALMAIKSCTQKLAKLQEAKGKAMALAEDRKKYVVPSLEDLAELEKKLSAFNDAAVAMTGGSKKTKQKFMSDLAAWKKKLDANAKALKAGIALAGA